MIFLTFSVDVFGMAAKNPNNFGELEKKILSLQEDSTTPHYTQTKTGNNENNNLPQKEDPL